MDKKKRPQSICIYQLKIMLRDTGFPIWRRIEIRSDLMLPVVHEVFQIAMGWCNLHDHLFITNKAEVYVSKEDMDRAGLFPKDWSDESNVRLSDILEAERNELLYEYDFWGCWFHRVLLERVIYKDVTDQETFVARCIGGKRACPPEHVGGPEMYVDFLATIEDPEDPEWMATRQWLGYDFNADSFDERIVNMELEILADSARCGPKFA